MKSLSDGQKIQAWGEPQVPGPAGGSSAGPVAGLAVAVAQEFVARNREISGRDDVRAARCAPDVRTDSAGWTHITFACFWPRP